MILANLHYNINLNSSGTEDEAGPLIVCFRSNHTKPTKMSGGILS